MEGNKNIPRFVGFITFAVLLHAFLLAPAVGLADVETENEEVEVPEYEYDGGGFDEHAFSSAEQMMEVAPVQSSSPLMFELLRTVEMHQLKRSMETGRDASRPVMDDDIVWRALVDANPFRSRQEVQSSLKNWAVIAASVIAGRREAAPPGKFEVANALYKGGQLEEASAMYREILAEYPGDCGARNNLALVQMHRGNDLLAQLHLEILASAYPDYVPALVNLTTVYVREGFVRKARNLSRTLAGSNKMVPMAAFNESWFLTGENKFDAASALMLPYDIDSLPSRYGEFRKQIDEMKALHAKKSAPKSPSEGNDLSDDEIPVEHGLLDLPKSPSEGNDLSGGGNESFWHTGLAGTLGVRSSVFGRIVAIVAFCFLAFLAMGISAAVGSGSANADGAGCITFAVVGTSLYILSWGIPRGGWGWTIFAAFLLVCGALSASASK